MMRFCSRAKAIATQFWKDKLLGNRQRDIEQQQCLRELGWEFLVIWECEIKDIEKLRDRIREFLG